MQSRSRWRVLLATLLLAAPVSSACAPAASTPRVPMRPAPVLQAAHNDTTTPFNFVSIPALTAHEYDGRGLRLGQVLASGIAFTRHHLTYRSGSLRVSGSLTVPNRPGRHPLVVLAHGYIPPDRYPTGGGLVREADHLAGRGYAVLLTDYRSFGESDRDGDRPVARPLGYPEDLVNAVLAVREADLPSVDASRVGVLGRSMGGGVALNALTAVPGLFDAAVLYSPVSARARDNFDRWVRDGSNRALRDQVVTSYGLPEDAPARWGAASAWTYLDRVRVPVQIHHGDADPVCPVGWSRRTAAELERLGKDVELVIHPGEDHRFDEAWPTFVRRTADFLDAHLR